MDKFRILVGIFLVFSLLILSLVVYHLLHIPKQHLLSCGNGKVDDGENCSNCPQDFPEEECICFNPPPVVQAHFDKKFYLCRGQSAEIDKYEIDLERAGNPALMNFVWSVGGYSTVRQLPEGKHRVLFLDVNVSEISSDKVLLLLTDPCSEKSHGNLTLNETTCLHIKETDVKIIVENVDRSKNMVILGVSCHGNFSFYALLNGSTLDLSKVCELDKQHSLKIDSIEKNHVKISLSEGNK
ncbi:MAG: hypothetical protein J7L23_04840 [Candidatus Diapherotrites archaeon]|nr:hypothetical protein [Candidatus Diapherotrites archaeon]